MLCLVELGNVSSRSKLVRVVQVMRTVTLRLTVQIMAKAGHQGSMGMGKVKDMVPMKIDS